MSNNSTFLSPDLCFSLCSLDLVAKNRSSAFNAVALSTSIAIAFLSPLAVVGNALVLAAIWRNTSLRTPSYIILCGLAFTDLCTGVITEPSYVAMRLIRLQKKKNQDGLPSFLVHVTTFCGTFFTYLTLVLVTLMSIERWLHMTRRSLLTVRRSCLIVALVSLLAISLAIFHYSSMEAAFILNIFFCVFLLFCLIATTISYFKVFRIIRRHQQQVQANENSRQPAIDILKYKKSMTSILYILGVFYVSYSPYPVVTVIFILKGYEDLEVAHVILTMFLFLSSSLNPVIYIYRMNEVRNEVKNLIKKLFCTQ